MLDQSFSNTNLNRIFLQDNRKGNFNKDYLSKEYLDKHEEFKNTLKEKVTQKAITGTLTKEQLDFFSEKLEKINLEKEEIRLNIFQDLSDKISEKTFQFKVDYNPEKEVFTIEKDAASYYAVKQLQINVHKTFKVKQANRNQIVKQLFHLLSDGYPKIVIKTDIKGFYESIPQDPLFTKIKDNLLLTPFSKKLISKLFFEYEQRKDKTIIPPKTGIPRGIGISAYLAELYLRDFDNHIKSMDDVIYYARYVDDIVIIFSPKTPSTKQSYLSTIKKRVSEIGLILKDGSDGGENKTLEIELLNERSKTNYPYTNSFNYLGYKFLITQTIKKGKVVTDLKIELSDNKLERYIKRIKLSISDYNLSAKFNEKRARRLLFERLKFLTGNYHLNNSKRKIKAGFFYSNSLLLLNNNMDSIYSINRIQRNLCRELLKLVPPSNILINPNNLKKYIWRRFSFKDGFFKKPDHFYSFNLTKKEETYYFTKFGRSVSKFEIVKSIWTNE